MIKAKKTRTLVILCILIVIMGYGLYHGIDFLANMPRERFQQKISYSRRVSYGAHMLYTLVKRYMEASPDPLAQTTLPIVNLDISRSAISELNSDLPKSGRVQHPGALTWPNGSSTAKVKYNGISINHWGMPHKSWNIVLESGKFNESKFFSLQIPRDETQLENWLGYEMSRRIGNVLTPDTDFVHFRLNNAFDGARLFHEQIDSDFLKRRNLPNGKLFNGDATAEEIYNDIVRPRLFSEPNGWDVTSPFPTDTSRDEIIALINNVQREKNPYDFYYRIQDQMEVDSLLHMMAVLEIVSSVHIDETHNWKLYLNPETKKLSPIIWNPVAYYWRNTKEIDVAPNDLFRAIIRIPGLQQRKDKIIWDAINGPLSEQALYTLIDDEIRKIKLDMYASPWKLSAGVRGINIISNQEWDESIVKLKDNIRERNLYFKNQLRLANAVYAFSASNADSKSHAARLAIKIITRTGCMLSKLVVKVPSASKKTIVLLTRRGIDDIKRPLRNEGILQAQVVNGEAEFKLTDTLLSKRRFERSRYPKVIPATYVYEFTTNDNSKIVDILSLEAKNAVTAEQCGMSRDSTLEIPISHVSNIVWWEPTEFIAGK